MRFARAVMQLGLASAIACAGCEEAPVPAVADAAPAAPRLADLPLHPGAGDPKVCVCEHASHANVWCEMHHVGYVAGIPVRSALLFKTLDAHGHEIAVSSLTFATRQGAAHDGGYCESCHIGWWHGQAYMTRLTWLLAQGERVSSSTPLCDACRARASAPSTADATWCDRCGGEVVGDVFFRDRQLALDASHCVRILARAIDAEPRCEMCACAMIYDRSCPVCRIRYVDGVGTPDDAPKPIAREAN